MLLSFCALHFGECNAQLLTLFSNHLPPSIPALSFQPFTSNLSNHNYMAHPVKWGEGHPFNLSQCLRLLGQIHPLSSRHRRHSSKKVSGSS
jgi:hypothetical protein